LGTKKDFVVKKGLVVTEDITLDDGGSLKEAGGTAALTFDGSGHITKIGQDSPSSDEVLTWDGSKAVWSSASLAADSTPQLGGDLDVNGNKITSASNADITIEPNGTGDILLYSDKMVVGDSSANWEIAHRTTTNSLLRFQSGGNVQLIADDAIYINSGEGGSNALIRLKADKTQVGNSNVDHVITTIGTGDLTLSTNDGTNAGTIVLADGANGDISITPNGTGQVNLGNFQFDADQSVGSGQDNYVLTYDHANTQIALEAAGGGGGASALNGLTDVSMDIANFADSLLIQPDSDGSAPSTGTLSSASDNIGIGRDVFNALTGGSENYVIGSLAGYSITSGSKNVIMGKQAGEDITTDTGNTILGYRAGQNATSDYNVAVGYQALQGSGSTALTGDHNVAIGYSTLVAVEGAAIGNIAIGRNALKDSTTADYNVAIGYDAADSMTTGSYNTAIGRGSLSSITTTTNNTAVGYWSGAGIGNGGDNTAIGYDTLGTTNSASQNTAVGSSSQKSNSGGSYNTSLGYRTLYGITSGTRNIAIGVQALDSITDETDNIAIGHESQYNPNGGDNNISLGNYAFTAITTGGKNTAIGHDAGKATTTAGYSTYMGYQSGYYATTQYQNTAFGANALYGASGTVTGGKNTAVGYNALKVTSTGEYNSSLGNNSLLAVNTGSYNIGVGFGAGDNITSGSNNVMIGGADAASATGSDQLSISSGDGSPVWITGDSNGNVSFNQLADVVAVSSNTTLTQAQSGSYVYWTAGTLTLPADAAVGTQYTIFNNTGGSVTVSLGSGDAMAGSWASNAAIADNDATAYVCVNISSSESQWVQVGA